MGNKFLKAYIRMENVIKFGDTEIQKQIFHQQKRPIWIKNIDINKIVLSYKVSFDKKYLNILMTTKIIKN